MTYDTVQGLHSVGSPESQTSEVKASHFLTEKIVNAENLHIFLPLIKNYFKNLFLIGG